MRTKYFQESIHCKIGSAPNIVPIYFWTLLNKSVHIGTLDTLNSATLCLWTPDTFENCP